LSHEQGNESAEGGKSQEQETRQSKPTGVKGAYLTGLKGAYLWGAASGLALAVFAPMLRPTAKAVVKSGIRIGRRATKVGLNLKEEFEDITAEAQADLERERPLENPPQQA
jgi:hypothetical protein